MGGEVSFRCGESWGLGWELTSWAVYTCEGGGKVDAVGIVICALEGDVEGFAGGDVRWCYDAVES